VPDNIRCGDRPAAACAPPTGLRRLALRPQVLRRLALRPQVLLRPACGDLRGGALVAIGREAIGRWFVGSAT
jgi:hypothetical protein